MLRSKVKNNSQLPSSNLGRENGVEAKFDFNNFYCFIHLFYMTTTNALLLSFYVLLMQNFYL